MFEESKPRYIVGPLDVYGAFALAGMLGPVVLGFADFIAAFSAAGYNPIRDSISSLALAPMGWLQTIGFLAIGLLLEVFVLGLFLGIRRGPGFGFSIGVLACFSFGLLLVGAFQTDPYGAPRTLEGLIHSVTSYFVFGAFPVACFLIAPSVRRDPYWKGLSWYTIAAGILGLVLIIASVWLRNMSWYGLYQRILVANMVMWIEIMAIWLMRLSLSLRLKSIQQGKTEPQSR